MYSAIEVFVDYGSVCVCYMFVVYSVRICVDVCSLGCLILLVSRVWILLGVVCYVT